MKNRTALVIAASVAVSSQLLGQNAIQVVLDTSVATPSAYRRSCVADDGGAVFLMNTPTGQALWKADPQGEPQWMMDLTWPIHTVNLIPRLGGGVLLTGVMDTLEVDGDPLEIVVVTAIDQNGSEVWRTGFHVFDSTAQFIIDWDELEFVQDRSGAIFVSGGVLSGEVGMALLFVAKLDGSGSLQWLRSYGQELGFVAPQWINGGGVQPSFAADHAGGGYLGSCDWNGPGHIMHITTNGDIDWVREYDYVNTAPYFEMFDLVCDTLGNVHVLGSMQQIGAQYGITATFGLNGQLLRSDLYSGLPQYGINAGVTQENGELLLSSGGQHYVEVAPDGSVSNAVKWTGTLLEPTQYEFYSGISTTGNRLSVAGRLNIQHVVFGYSTLQPAIWSIDMDQPDGCMMETFEVLHYQIPDTIFVSNPLSDYLSMELIAVSYQFPLALSPRVPIGTSAFCTQLWTSVAEGSLGSMPFTVLTNPVAADEAITVLANEPLVFNLLNVHGALAAPVARATSAGQFAITRTGLGSGMYIIQAWDREGVFRGAAKLVLN